MKPLVLVVSAVASLALLGACGGGNSTPSTDAPLTWEEFRARVFQEPDTGMFITNGDELVENETELREVYARYVADQQEIQAREQGLIVNRVGGQDDRWSATAALNLNYCVSKKDFGSQYTNVVNALNSATGAWESSARVNFIHASAFDDNCSSRTNGVVFNVRLGRSGQYLARAFFPSTSRKGREIIIDITSFGNIAPWTLTGVLRHELGHAIGFRHEHTRPESGVCFEDNNWRALTAYDSSSVMHYPQCNGTQNGDLQLTSADRTGAGSLYP